jgi:hypothetical protein
VAYVTPPPGSLASGNILSKIKASESQPAFPFNHPSLLFVIIMAVIPISDSSQTITIMSPQSLFLGLFFGLGGGMLLFIIFSAVILWRFSRQGRIRLGAGGPGDFDDEQTSEEEEASAMERLDSSQLEAYYRAKGTSLPIMAHN